ncbi:MAG: Hpt domain-containing protein [Pseudomonadota bacterium]
MQTKATEIYDNIVLRLRQEFLDEAMERADNIEMTCSNTHFGKIGHADALIIIRRQAHNLKGMGSSFQFPIIALIAHRLEDYIADIREITARHAKDIEGFVDVLRELLGKGIEGLTPNEEEQQAILRRLPAKWAYEVEGVAQSNREFLLATPSKVAARLVERQLQGYGHRVVAASSAMEAFELGIRMKPDMVITSAIMEDITGVDLARAFHVMKATSHIPFVLLTSFPKNHDALKDLPETSSVVRIGSSFSDDLQAAMTKASVS